MPSRISVIVGLIIICVGSTLIAADKSHVRVSRIGEVPARDLYLAPSLVTADTCIVNENQEITMRIDGWVLGFELYKSLLDPANSCANPYPFTVTAINMPMIFDAATPISMAVDVEAIDTTTIPGCAVPGELLAVSSQWEAQIPEAGIYNIWIALDTPVVVTGPFFAGFYLGNSFAEGVNPAVLIDEFPVTCATYNIWDEAVGWVDLANNEIYNFPGRLAMEAAGVPGESSEPALEILTPSDGDLLLANQDLWAWDAQQTGVVDYILFEYSNGGPFVEIGRDFDGSSPLRDGVNPASLGTGFGLNWDFSSAAEGSYDLRVTLVDTLGGSQSQTISVYLEPTPPIAGITSPADGSAFCPPVDIRMQSSDENISMVLVDRHAAEGLLSLGVVPFDQALAGDSDGDPTDGNRASSGEFGDFYSAPVAAATATALWSDRGYTSLMWQGTRTMTVQEVAEELAALFGTRASHGTYDEAVFSGLRSYAADHRGGFDFDIKRQPNYTDLRVWVESDEHVVMLGLGGNPGLWVTVDGFTAWQRNDNTWLVDIANPLTGNLESVAWRNLSGYSEIQVAGQWHRVDLMIAMFATDWDPTRSVVGMDLNSSDGWSVSWPGAGLIDGDYHYLRSEAKDQDTHVGVHTILVQHNCAAVFVPGDYDNDRSATISDLLRLIEFVAQDGPAPDGGALRADCNCDQVINVADIIYYMNYLYGTASPPCR